MPNSKCHGVEEEERETRLGKFTSRERERVKRMLGRDTNASQRNAAQHDHRERTGDSGRDRDEGRVGWMDGQADRHRQTKEQNKPRITREWAHHGDKSDSSHSPRPPFLALAGVGVGWDWHRSLAGRHDTGPEVEVRGLIGGRAAVVIMEGAVQFCGAHPGRFMRSPVHLKEGNAVPTD